MATRTDERTLNVPIGKTIDGLLAQEIEKQSVYLSEDVIRLSVSADLKDVNLVLKPGADLEVIQSKLGRFLGSMVRGHRRIEPVVHHKRTRREPRPYTPGVFDELQRRGWLFQHSTGVVSLSGPALELYDLIDRTFAEEYARLFAPVRRPFPAMVGANLLARCGYFEMHPNALSFVSHLVNDFDEIESFRQANKSKTDGLYLTEAKAFAKPRHCLNPAACFPCYEAFEGKQVPGDGMSLTWVGRVFRYESANTVGLDRLWEFNVRELVFLGGDQFIKERREQAVRLIQALLERWDLEGQIETATDPFFATVYATKALWQRSMDVKHELRLYLSPPDATAPRSVAVGSVNLHGAFFGERFAISNGQGEPAHSACVGFGLERWVLALFTQYGFEAENWPESLRGVLGT
jgi:hypothetical protein